MSITIHTPGPGINIITVSDSDMYDFKQLINRGMNCWDKAPPKLKSFADRLMLGKELQDYHNISMPKPRPDQ